MTERVPLAAAVVVAALAATPAARQDSTFKAGTRTVAVYATVTDAAAGSCPT